METTMQERVHFDWREVTKLGLLSGLAALFVCLVGMIDTFGEKDVIGGLVSQGQMLLILIWFGFGYLVNRRVPGGSQSQTISGGALVGAITSGMLIVLVLIAEPFNLRSVLVEASPALVEDLTMGLGVGLGSLVLLIAGLAFGALGAAVPSVPEGVRRPLLMALAWVLAIGVFQDVLAPIPAVPRVIARFMFDMSGLSIVGAIVVFVIVGGLTFLWSKQGDQVR